MTTKTYCGQTRSQLHHRAAGSPFQAASNGHGNLCKELVKRGANVNATNNSLYTPLHWAAYKVRTPE